MSLVCDGDLVKCRGILECGSNAFRILDSFLLLETGHQREGKLPQAGQGQKNGYEPDSTFTLHTVVC
jgi:hypothetical protein